MILKNAVKQMMHILILPLSLLVKTNPMATVAAFRGLGIGLHSMIWNWRKTIQCIEKYKSGLLFNDQFIDQLKVIYPKLNLIAESAIWEAWNKMCTVEAFGKEAFSQLEALEQSGISVYIFSRTNRAHVAHIQDQLGKNIPGKAFYSYDHGNTKGTLSDSLMHEIKTQFPNVQTKDIQYYYKDVEQGPFAKLWWFPPLRWLLSPLGMWFHKSAVNHVSNLKKESQSKGYSLLAFNFTTTPAITKQLENLGWINSDSDKLDISTSSTLLVRRSARIAQKQQLKKSLTTQEELNQNKKKHAALKRF